MYSLVTIKLSEIYCCKPLMLQMSKRKILAAFFLLKLRFCSTYIKVLFISKENQELSFPNDLQIQLKYESVRNMNCCVIA